jgi:hypothetical protein
MSDGMRDCGPFSKHPTGWTDGKPTVGDQGDATLRIGRNVTDPDMAALWAEVERAVHPVPDPRDAQIATLQRENAELRAALGDLLAQLDGQLDEHCQCIAAEDIECGVCCFWHDVSAGTVLETAWKLVAP